MNDKEFRENCKVLANDIIDFHCGWKKVLLYQQIGSA